jgi:hypothetical protein
MAQDTNYIYWLNTSAGAVMRTAKDGSISPVTPQFLDGAGAEPAGIAIVGSNPAVYWVQNTSGVPASADFYYLSLNPIQSPKPLGMSFEGQVYEMTTNGTTLFWTVNLTSLGTGAVMFGGTGGVPMTTLCGPGTSCTTSSPYGIALDSSYVYWTDIDGAPSQGSVNRIPINGGSVFTYATKVNSPQHIAVYGSYVYYQDGSNLMRVDTAGITKPSAISTGTAGGGIAADSSGVYWTDAFSTVYAWPTGATGPTKIATGQGLPDYIETDATTIYWTNNTSGTVMAVAK